MTVSGTVAPRLEPVAEAFSRVVDESPGTGSALAVWRGGEWVVDLWGGYVDAARTRPWRRDSIVMPYSVSKPFAALCALVLVDRGLLDLDRPLAAYWPELSTPTTLRQVLAHRSGVVALDRPAPVEAFYDWDLMCRLVAEQAPAWPPGTAHGESPLLFGHLVGEVVRRVDGRGPGRFLREEVCAPLGLDFHVGLADAEQHRVVELTGLDADFRRASFEGRALLEQAMSNPPGVMDPRVVNGRAWRAAEVPAVNGHGTARAVAGLYAALQDGRLLSEELLRLATGVAGTGPDLVLGDERAWGLGFAVEQDGYGMAGMGGSLGWWSVRGQYAFGFVTGHLGTHERCERLEEVLCACLGLAPREAPDE